MESNIEKHISREESCWRWTGWIRGKGYGCIQIKGKRIAAHRLIHELEKGPIPDGYEVDHLCSNKWCVNPEHLEAVTPEENRNRAARKRVENHPNCPHGHPYSGTNLIWGRLRNGKPYRLCKECHRLSCLEYKRSLKK